MTMSGHKARSLRDIFGRKKSTYGLILPEELEARALSQISRKSRRQNAGVKDCFVPSDLDRWELPQYESLFNHLITQDGSFKRRLSCVSTSNNREPDESTSTTGGTGDESSPFKTVQKWFREVVKSITHHSGDYDLGGDIAVEGIPVDMCEKLRYVHIYF